MDTLSIEDAIADLQLFGIPAPFNFGSATERKDSSRVIAEITQGGLGLPGASDYAKDDLRAAYEQHVASMLRAAGIKGDAAEIVGFEKTLADASLTREQRRSDPNATYNITRVDDLPPVLDWHRFFARGRSP